MSTPPPTRLGLVAALVLPLTAVVGTAPAVATDWPRPRWSSTVVAAEPNLATATASATQEVGVVDVRTSIDYGEGEAAGTGMVISSDGLVVTNHHVVQGATSITVTVVSTGRSYTADLVGDSARKDVAVLRLEDASGLATVTTDTSGVTAGETVTSVGDAGGDAGSLTAAPGSVTDAERTITVSDDEGGQSRLRNLIEVSSDIVAGDSGGALYDADGEVVGMNVAASSGTPDVTGYVIPIARVLRVADHVLAGQTVGDIALGYDAFLGVELSGASATIAGVLVDSPAATAGLTGGDTVTSVGGTTVATAGQLSRAIAAHAAGDRVTVRWTDQSGTAHAATVDLERAPIA